MDSNSEMSGGPDDIGTRSSTPSSSPDNVSGIASVAETPSSFSKNLPEVAWAAEAGARVDGCASWAGKNKATRRFEMRRDEGGFFRHFLGRPTFSSVWSALSTDAFARLPEEVEAASRTTYTNFLFRLEENCAEAEGMWNEGTGGHEGPVKFHYHIPVCPGPSTPDRCWIIDTPIPLLYRGVFPTNEVKGLIVGIEGIPGSGKTTLLQTMRESKQIVIAPGSAFEGHAGPWKAHFLAMLNPWASFTKNPEKNCEAFLRWRGEMIRETCSLRPLDEGALFMEGSVLPSFMAMAALKLKWMSEAAVLTHLALEKKSNFHTDHPDYLIIIRTKPEVALKRLRERDLPGDKDVSLDFLKACDEELGKFVECMPHDYVSRTFVIENDAEIDGVLHVINEIHGFFPSMRTARIGNVAPVTLMLPEKPLVLPTEGETKQLVTQRIADGVGLMMSWCTDCKLPSYIPVNRMKG